MELVHPALALYNVRDRIAPFGPVLSMPLAGSIIMFDSLLFLFGVLKKDDLLYSEKEEELQVLHVKKGVQIKTKGSGL
jgi:hypothetical protein